MKSISPSLATSGTESLRRAITGVPQAMASTNMTRSPVKR